MMKTKFLIVAALVGAKCCRAGAQQITKFVTGVAPGASVDSIEDSSALQAIKDLVVTR
jgi:hypothetical protein